MRLKVNFDAQAALQAMERSPEKTVNQMRQALNEACRLVQRGARANHRFTARTGMLERAVQFRINAGKCEGIVNISPTIAPYGKYVHEGTRRHEIRAKNKRFLRFIGRGGEFVFRKKVMHPGTTRDQFLYNSAERSRAEINAIFARHVQQAVREAGL